MGDSESVSEQAASLSKLGASKGGAARAARLTAEERRQIAQRAADARWGQTVHFAPYSGVITIGDIGISCAVFEDGTRVLSQATVLRALGRNPEKSRRPGRDSAELRAPFLSANNLQPFITSELQELAEPIRYRAADDTQGNPSWGYKAEMLPLLCEVYLQAAEQKKLAPNQREVAKAAGILVRGLARVGIVALVDEATGYQEVRARDALAKILEAYVAKELQPWVRTFPADYYREIFRLRDLEYPKATVKRPRYFGTITNDIVYRRLAPGVLAELKRVQIKDDDGRPKHKLFQRLTANRGYPQLREHLGSVVAIMKLSRDWADFRNKLDQLHPRYGDTMVLPFDDEGTDSGTGL
jgi:P63C domain